MILKMPREIKRYGLIHESTLLGLISLSLVGVDCSSWLITSKDSPSRDTPLDSIGADGEFSDINQYSNTFD